MGFNINNKLIFIENFQFLSSLVDSSVNNLGKYELAKNFKEKLPGIYSSLTDKRIIDKEYEHVLKVSDRCEMKLMKYYHYLYLKCDVLLLADVFEKFKIEMVA